MPWYERDGLDTWYKQNKCSDFLRDADKHFKNMKMVNFDILKNQVSEDKLKQYLIIDHHEIMRYPPKLREEICSSIFRNIKRVDMFVKKKQLMNILKIKNLLGVGE